MMEPFISSSLLDEVVEEAAEELLEKCRSGRVKEEKIGELFFELLVKHIIIIEKREENAFVCMCLPGQSLHGEEFDKVSL